MMFSKLIDEEMSATRAVLMTEVGRLASHSRHAPVAAAARAAVRAVEDVCRRESLAGCAIEEARPALVEITRQLFAERDALAHAAWRAGGPHPGDARDERVRSTQHAQSSAALLRLARI